MLRWIFILMKKLFLKTHNNANSQLHWNRINWSINLMKSARPFGGLSAREQSCCRYGEWQHHQNKQRREQDIPFAPIPGAAGIPFSWRPRLFSDDLSERQRFSPLNFGLLSNLILFDACLKLLADRGVFSLKTVRFCFWIVLGSLLSLERQNAWV